MITRYTTLILGAGASIPFGFPSGPKLKAEVCKCLKYGRINKLLQINGFKEEQINQFRNDLTRSPDYSVDAFLEHHDDYLNLGKQSIAITLLPYEKTEFLFDKWVNQTIGLDLQGKPLSNHDISNNNWYQYLFSRMDTSFDDFSRNRLHVITFNYDRSLEQYLFISLKSKFQKKSDDDCARVLSNIPIVHVYGSLGKLPWQMNRTGPIVPYDCNESSSDFAEHVRKAAENIKIIHEAVKKSPEFENAHEIISEGGRIYFLGFGFHRQNVIRLLTHENRKKSFTGTVYNLSPHILNELAEKYGIESMGTSFRKYSFFNQKIYDFLYYNEAARLD